MVHTTRAAMAALGLFAAFLAVGPAGAATFQGRSVDGRRYQASVLNNDWGRIDDVEVRFHSEHAYVYIRGAIRLVLILDDEEIADPHRIPAADPMNGVQWEIDIKDLVGR